MNIYEANKELFSALLSRYADAIDAGVPGVESAARLRLDVERAYNLLVDALEAGKGKSFLCGSCGAPSGQQHSSKCAMFPDIMRY